MITAAVAGLSAGAIHVLAGPDHLAAVAPLAADREQRPWAAGLLWGLGHAAGVVVVGVAALLLREVLPVERLSRIYFRGRFFNYPLTAVNVVLNLGIRESVMCLASYLLARTLVRVEHAAQR